MILEAIFITSKSCTIEIKNNSPFYTLFTYDVYINDELKYKNQNKNCFSIYDLSPDTEYVIKIKSIDEEKEIQIKTKAVSFIINVKDFIYGDTKDHTLAIQAAIMACPIDGLVIIPKGIYNLRPIFLKDNINIYIEENAVLIADTNRENYPIFKGSLINGNKEYILGTWEGEPNDIFCSIINGINVKNINIFGKGIIDGNAANGDWWVNPKVKRGAYRPRGIFLNNCFDVNIQGITVRNTASWAVHPFYSNKVSFYTINIINPEDSPNTDGLNPESCENVRIIGVEFSVGDDCIAIKSGKIYMANNHYKPSSNIIIRNCLMNKGHGAIVFGSEMSSGINNLEVSQCVFLNTDRGFRLKTRRGRGNKGVISNIVFDNIYMKGVKNAFVINMFYFCDFDGKSEYVQSKKFLPVDDRTPYLGSLSFKNVVCEECYISAGYFYGLPESKIASITLENVKITYAHENLFEKPAMMCDIDDVSKLGFYFNNVNEVILKNVMISGQNGKEFIFENVNKINNSNLK